MKQLTLNGQIFACPFFDLLRPLTDQEYADLEAGILEEGELLDPIRTFQDTDNELVESIWDGMHRARICEKHGIEAEIKRNGKMSRAVAERRALNKHKRRHLTPEEQKQLREKRRPKVAAAKTEGKSNRTIAKELGVTEKTVRNDLQKTQSQPGADPSAPDRIKGKDGKSYPPPKPPPKKKSKPRKTIPEKMLAITKELTKLFKRYTSGESNASPRARAGVIFAWLGIPLTAEGTGLPWCETLAMGFRELGPGVRS